MCVQGSAADAVKGVMICLQEQLAATGLGDHCHMLLQVSDSRHEWLVLLWSYSRS
jgi:DNA polymerase I-like protein with 3'-5' exonuclease and polymerase domains